MQDSLTVQLYSTLGYLVGEEGGGSRACEGLRTGPGEGSGGPAQPLHCGDQKCRQGLVCVLGTYLVVYLPYRTNIQKELGGLYTLHWVLAPV
jgi:hypothetical protein